MKENMSEDARGAIARLASQVDQSATHDGIANCDALVVMTQVVNSYSNMRSVLAQMLECDLNESNCASFEVATKRIRNLAKRGLS